MPAVHVIISTHTTLHLRRTIMGAVCQRRRPDGIVVSCDNDRAEIREAVRGASAEFSVGITLVRRAFAGRARSAQVRNNAVRGGLEGLDPGTRLVFLDGDCCPAPDAVWMHERLGVEEGGGRLVLGHRVDLSEEQTAVFSEAALREGRLPAEPTAEQWAALRTRQKRFERQCLMRRLGLGKSHKPKLLSANFSVTLGLYRDVNGFDETYEGYGQEDDDFGRRCYRAQGLPVVAVTRALVFHLFHPTRAPGDWHDSPNAGRFAAGERGPVRCERGLDRALEQDDLRVEEFQGGEPIREWTISQGAGLRIGPGPAEAITRPSALHPS